MVMALWEKRMNAQWAMGLLHLLRRRQEASSLVEMRKDHLSDRDLFIFFIVFVV
jgi:hypothetical protein